MSLIKSNSYSIMLIHIVNLTAAKSVDGRVTSSAGAGFESPRQLPRSSLRGRL